MFFTRVVFISVSLFDQFGTYISLFSKSLTVRKILAKTIFYSKLARDQVPATLALGAPTTSQLSTAGVTSFSNAQLLQNC